MKLARAIGDAMIAPPTEGALRSLALLLLTVFLTLCGPAQAADDDSSLPGSQEFYFVARK
jgi:hypothetical protein